MKCVFKWITQHSAYGIYSIRRSFKYKIAFFISLLSGLVQPVIMYFIWDAAFMSKPLIAGFTQKQMLTYFFVSQAINCLFGFQNAPERQILSRVRSGDIALDLLKPVNFVASRFFETLGSSLIQLIISITLLSIIAIVYPGFILPTNPFIIISFCLSVIMGFIIVFSIGITTGFIAFFTLNISGIYFGRKAIVDLMSGAVIPLMLLPSWAQSLSDILPFKGIVYTPVLIFLEQYSSSEIVRHLLLSLFWIIVMWLVSWLVYQKAIKKVTVHGG